MKKFLPLLVILVLLIIIAFLVEFPSRRGSSRSTVLVNAQPSTVTSVTITRGAAAASLRASEDGWRVMSKDKEYAADSGRVAATLEALKGMTGELVSVNPDNQALFGVDESSATRVEVRGMGDSLLASVLVGKPNKDFTGTYVRLTSSNEVHSVGGFLKSYFHAEPNFYRKRTMLRFSESNLDTLRFLYPGRPLSFARDTLGNMTLIGTHEELPDTSSVRQAIAALSTLTATGFEDEVTLEEAGLNPPQLEVVLVMNDGSSDTLLIGNLKDSKSYCVRKSGDPVVYLIPKSTTERFMRDRSSFLGG